MTTLIQKFAAHYDCTVSLFGSLLIIANNNRQVKIKFFTTLPEVEQRQKLVLARNTLNIKERIKVKEILNAAINNADDEALAMLQEPQLPWYNTLPPHMVSINGTISCDAAYHWPKAAYS